MATANSQLLVKITGDVSGLKSAMRSAKSEVKGLGESISGSMKSAGASMTGLGKKLSLVVTAPLAAVGVMAVKTAGDFESQMNLMKVAAGDTGESLEDLRAAAIGVGADTKLVGISASEAADSITELYKSGKTTNEIFGDMQGYLAGTAELGGVLRASIDLAAASELELAAATQLVNDTLGKFGLEASDATMVIDLLVGGADASTASVSDLEGALSNAGTTLHGMKVPLGETVTLFAMLSEAGIRGAEAGTQVKSMFNTLTSGTKPVRAAMQELKFDIYDATGTMKPMGQIIDELNVALGENAKMTYQAGGATKAQAKELTSYSTKIRNAKLAIEEYSAGVRGANLSDAKRAEKIAELTKKIGFYEGKQSALLDVIPGVTQATVDMTDARRKELVTTLAGAYGQNALNAILGQGIGAYDEMADKITKSSTAAEIAAIRTRGYEGAMEQLSGAWETFLITVGTPIIESITPLIVKVSDFIGKLALADPAMLNMIVKFALIAAAVGPVLIVLGSVVSAIGTLIGVFSAVGGIIATVGGAIAGVIAAIGWPILIVIAAIAALYLAWKTNFLGMKDALQPFLDSLSRMWSIISGVFSDIGKLLKGEISWDEFVMRAKIAWERFKIVAAQAWENLKAGILRIWDNIKAAVLQKLAEFIGPLVGGVDEAKEKILTAWENVKTGVSNAWEKIKEIAATVWEGIKTTIDNSLEWIRGLFASFILFLSGDFSGAWETLKETLSTIWGGILVKAEEIWGNIKTTIEDIWTGLKETASTKWGEVTTAIGDKVGEAKTKLSDAWDEMKEKAGTKWDEIKGVIDDKVKLITGIISTIWETISGIGGEIISGIMGAIGGIGGGGGLEMPDVEGGPMAWAAALKETFETMATAVTENLTAMSEAYMTTTAAILETHTTWLATLLMNLTTHQTTVLEQTTTHLTAIQTLTMTVWTTIQIFLIATWTLLLATFTIHMISMFTTSQNYWTQIMVNTIALMTQMKATVEGIFNSMREAIKKILEGVKKDAYSAGKAIGQALADGLRAKIGAVRAAARALAAAARANLPGSDAKEGPLKDLTASGRALPVTFAKGMMQGQGAMQQALGAMFTGPTPARVAGVRQTPGEITANSGANNSANYTVIINNPVGETSERSLNKVMRRVTYLGEQPTKWQPVN